MNEHHRSIAWRIVLVVIAVTLILSVAKYEIQKSSLKVQAIPQVVIENETP